MLVFSPFKLVICTILASLPRIICAESCRSNETHICWKCGIHANLEEQQQRTLLNGDCDHWIQTRHAAERDAIKFLRANVMAFDILKLETLGFATESAADGLDYGIIGPSIQLALNAKVNYTWTDHLPRDLFYEYVMNYAHTNEGRTNWRPLLTPTVHEILNGSSTPVMTIEQVVVALNTHLWTKLASRENDSIVFVGGQTPLIFDPMSVIAFGYASCTGLAILFASALRAAGVPARIAGTPAWYGQRGQGNHNWVEVYHEDGTWKFMEPSPKQDTIDSLDRDPCQRWFCHKDRFGNGTTRVYAARLDHSKSMTPYPLAWEWNSNDVPGDDRTYYYTEICSQC